MQRQLFSSLGRAPLKSSNQRSSGYGLTARPSFASPSFYHHRLLSNDVKQKIDAAVAKSPIVLFMKGTPTVPQCGFSRAVVQILDVQGVPSEKLKSYNVLEDAELREAIKEYSSWPTIPQVYVKGEFIGGCDIVLGMHQSGELEKTLVESGIIEPKSAA